MDGTKQYYEEPSYRASLKNVTGLEMFFRPDPEMLDNAASAVEAALSNAGCQISSADAVAIVANCRDVIQAIYDNLPIKPYRRAPPTKGQKKLMGRMSETEARTAGALETTEETLRSLMLKGKVLRSRHNGKDVYRLSGRGAGY